VSLFTVRSIFAICQATELNSAEHWLEKATQTAGISVDECASQLRERFRGGLGDAGLIGSR
jgi:hypothetical protein